MIDGGPLRVSRPTSRQDAYRAESVRHQPHEPERADPDGPRAPRRQAEPEYREPRAPRDLGWTKWLVAVVIVIAIGVGGWLLWSNQGSLKYTVDPAKYQAVHLSNGQVYFGKLSFINSNYMQLTNVYYLERQLTANTDSDEDGENSGDNNFQLLKYSDVLYGSEDAMIISANDIIRYENLRPDGVVARAIADRR